MYVTSDIYEYIIGLVNEKDLMNMFRVNKYFYNEKMLLRVMNKKFPLLSRFKKKETWRKFYIKMLHYISEIFLNNDIPYMEHISLNPQKFYNKYKNDKKKMYNTLMKYAINVGKTNIVQLLLERKADNFKGGLLYAVKSNDIKNVTFMLYAVKSNDIENVTFMLSKGADEIVKPLYVACKRGLLNIVKILLQQNIKLKGYIYDNAIHYACKTGHIDIINFLLTKRKKYKSVASSAAKYGHKEIINVLLNKDIDKIDILNNSAKGGHIDIVNLMIDVLNKSNLMIDKGVKTYHTALYNAASKGHIDILIRILKEIEIFDFFSVTCAAIKSGNLNIVKFLIEKYNQLPHIYIKTAVYAGYLDIVNFFIEKGYNNYDQIMISAAEGGKIEIIKSMIERGATDFTISIEKASRGGHFHIVKFLLTKTDNYRYSIFEAKQNEQYHIVNLLKKKQKQDRYSLNFKE